MESTLSEILKTEWGFFLTWLFFYIIFYSRYKKICLPVESECETLLLNDLSYSVKKEEEEMAEVVRGGPLITDDWGGGGGGEEEDEESTEAVRKRPRKGKFRTNFLYYFHKKSNL